MHESFGLNLNFCDSYFFDLFKQIFCDLFFLNNFSVDTFSEQK